jgi:hypothetical protein
MIDTTPVDNSTQEKKWLLQICGGCMAGLVALGMIAITHGVDTGGATILGVIVGGLVTFGKDIIAAVRSYSMAASLARVTDQVAAAGPPATAEPVAVTVTNTPAEPVPVATTS